MKKLLFILSALPLLNAYSAYSYKWNTIDPNKANINYLELYDIQKYIFDKNAQYKTNSLIIIKDGKIVFEKYQEGFDSEKPQKLWSISKSIASALIGIAIKEEKLSLNDKVSDLFPELKSNEQSSKITLKDLLQMSSGIQWKEGYEDNILKSNVLESLYGPGKNDMAKYTANQPAICQPGACFNYSSGDTNLMMGYLKKVLKNEVYQDYPWQALFNKLHIKTASWERDSSGTFVGSSYVYMTIRDLAKIGLLYLNEGKFQDHHLIHSNYIKWSTKLAPSFVLSSSEERNENKSYGAQWWLNVEDKDKKLMPAYPDIPQDAYFALGHWGQVMAIIPSDNLVVIRTGSDKKDKIDINKMVSMIIKAIRSEGELK